jgi:type II secretory pathway pseudopilin PulG
MPIQQRLPAKFTTKQDFENMKRGPKTLFTCNGFSILDLLIVMVMIGIVVSLALPFMRTAQKPLLRANAVQQFSSYLQEARSDSKKRRASAAPQMAQITILSDRYYYVMIDSNGDGVLDPPLVVNLEDRRIRMNGPFPRTFMFDWLGRVFDPNQNMVLAPAVTFTNESGKTVVNFADAGQPALVVSK